MYKKTVLNRIKNRWLAVIREKYNMRKRHRLRNTCPTIICRNCVGGIMYHDLGLKFSSPTVNLLMEHSDFITFVENLQWMISGEAELREIKDENVKCPVGELHHGGIRVRIEFTHYKSFEEAKNKWVERESRMDLSNLYIIWECANQDGPDEQLWRRFKSLPYENKVLITGKGFPIQDEDVFYTDLYDDNYYYGKILDFRKGLKFYKRYLDDFDYVRFLNG